jgi:hypothetical protein
MCISARVVAGRRRRPGRVLRRRCRTWTWRPGRGARVVMAGTMRLLVVMVQPGRTMMAMRSSRMAGRRSSTKQQQKEMMQTGQAVVMTRMMVVACC